VRIQETQKSTEKLNRSLLVIEMDNQKKSNKKNKRNKKKQAAQSTTAVAEVVAEETNENTTVVANSQTAEAVVEVVESNNEELKNDLCVEKITANVENDEDNVLVVVEEVKDLAEMPQINKISINQEIGPVQQVVQHLTPQSQSNFDNLQKAVDILGKAKSLDESKQFENALKLYRQGVDMLLEELIERQGTEQSRDYLRTKCNDFMNRIDQIKLIIRIENETANKENC
jgi:hypothetical protein